MWAIVIHTGVTRLHKISCVTPCVAAAAARGKCCVTRVWTLRCACMTRPARTSTRSVLVAHHEHMICSGTTSATQPTRALLRTNLPPPSPAPLPPRPPPHLPKHTSLMWWLMQVECTWFAFSVAISQCCHCFCAFEKMILRSTFYMMEGGGKKEEEACLHRL